jgi:hypothetical protein
VRAAAAAEFHTGNHGGGKNVNGRELHI